MNSDPNDINPSMPNIHDDAIAKCCRIIFWSFALAVAGVIVMLML